MTIFETILAIIFIAFTLILAVLSLSALQLIKELKKSLAEVNKILEKPENIHPAPLKKFEDVIAFRPPASEHQTPRLFRHSK